MKNLLAGLLLLQLMLGMVNAEAAGRIDSVTATVEADGMLPPLVQQRMQASVGAIAEQLLLGQRLADVRPQQAAKEAVIREVFDKVLVGYTVKSVSLSLAEATVAKVELLPWADVIRCTDVTVEIEGMPPLIEELVREDIAGVGEVLDEGLCGLPVAAADWSNGVLKRRLNDFMAERLPEFRADLDVEPGETAKVNIVVYPRLPVVRTTSLSMRSDTVPNFALLNYRRLLQDKANLLVGVPVSFVARHESELCRMMAESLDSQYEFRMLGLHTAVTLQAGENLTVMSRSDTKDYRIRLEGWLDIGHSRNRYDDLRFRLHVGRCLSGVDEIFLQVDAFPQSVSLDWSLGYAREVVPNGQLQMRYDFSESDFAAGFQQALIPNLSLRYEYRWSDRLGEFDLRYRLHDFISLEYAVDKTDNWLRLVGNF